GRCDALYFSTDPDDVPPDGSAELEAFRREKCGISVTDDPEMYDLIVAGGGVAGCVTALAAARLGLKSLLIQDRSITAEEAVQMLKDEASIIFP
ncbi:MAG: FAD-dependent oxidoreductase, partial [Clostridia bacterium]|nr:FAD-dependent oxidoreductase [Clostridia bacterium]